MLLPLLPRLLRLREPTAVLHSTVLNTTVQHARCQSHALHASACTQSKALPPRTVLLDSDLIENFLKGSGPGGQKINKTSSAVQLKHIPTGIVVKYQDTRSREVNRKMARRILQDRIEELEKGEDARTRVRAREKSKKKASSAKKSRRKYRALEAEKDGESALEGQDSSEVGFEKADEIGSVETETPHIHEPGKSEKT